MVRKLHYGSPNFDAAAQWLAEVVNRADGKFTPGEADFWLRTLINARTRDQEAQS